MVICEIFVGITVFDFFVQFNNTIQCHSLNFQFTNCVLKQENGGSEEDRSILPYISFVFVRYPLFSEGWSAPMWSIGVFLHTNWSNDRIVDPIVDDERGDCSNVLDVCRSSLAIVLIRTRRSRLIRTSEQERWSTSILFIAASVSCRSWLVKSDARALYLPRKVFNCVLSPWISRLRV